MTTGERMKMLRRERDIQIERIASAMGVSVASVYRYENGDIEKVPGKMLEPLAAILGTTPAYLMGWDDEPRNTAPVSASDNLSEIRFLGDVAAGYNHCANEEYEIMRVPTEWLHGRPAREYFAMRVVGSSMYPMYCDGDEVLCLSCNDMGQSGRVGVIVYGDGEVTLKRIEFAKGEDWVDLVPINPEYQTKRIEGCNLDSCRVIGRAMRLIRTVGVC